MEIRQRLIFPARLQTSIFSAEGLNFCVRNGNRWDLFAIITAMVISVAFATYILLFTVSTPLPRFLTVSLFRRLTTT